MLDFRYLDFCHAGELFYDRPSTGPSESEFPQAESVPEGWETGAGGDWAVRIPVGCRLPAQGWKIHVSATLDNAPRILDTVHDYCRDRRIPFKFIRSLALLHQRSSKYADRGASGKFITIYSRDEAELERILTDLDAAIGGEAGPYVLTDLRWRAGPLYVRYGGFAVVMARNANGELVHCIEAPDGELVPDERKPGFRVPPWVTIPDFLNEAVADRAKGSLQGFPFRPYRAVHFSNGGGVYRAVHTESGTEVLLKEARPLAGLDSLGREATERLACERWALEKLAGLSHVPELIDYRQGHEHMFLVREFVEGTPLNQVFAQRNPLLTGRGTAQDHREYTDWALDLLARIERGVRDMHERGVVYGDLHPGNILIGPDGEVSFIDFETSTPVSEPAPQTLAALGFTAPPDLYGTDVDLFALNCVRLSVFAPLTHLMSWGSAKTEQVIELVADRFPVPADFIDGIRAAFGAPEPAAAPARPLWSAPEPATWPETRARLASAALGAAAPERNDRLYPGDIAQFLDDGGGLGLAHGAAGVLWALHTVGEPVPEEHVQWLVSRSRAATGLGPGLGAGYSGIAHALADLGRTGPAEEALDAALAQPRESTGPGLIDGLAGLGMTLLRFSGDAAEEAAGSGTRMREAAEIGARLAALWTEGTPAPRPGLLRGGSGQAVFLIRLFERTGDPALLDAAERAVRADMVTVFGAAESLDHVAANIPGGLAGSHGMAVALDMLLAHRPDKWLADIRGRLLDAARRPILNGAGLFSGRAGALFALRAAGMADPDTSAAVHRHLADFGWDTVDTGDGLHTLGDQGLRLSTDLATGTAGVLVAIDAAVEQRPGELPFFGAAQARPPAAAAAAAGESGAVA
ncbi:class III lanthionine synthetase LanKC [Streptomonospora sediminis]